MHRVSGKVLIVDDDAEIREMLEIHLRKEGYDAVLCGDGARAVTLFRERKPDLVLLDLMLPGIDGIEVCRQIRQTSGVPIIMLTARTETADVVTGLESGADDYVVKPFKTAELLARIRRRLPPTLRIGDLVIDVTSNSVRRGEDAVALTPLECQLLVCLARKPWQVFSRERLLEEVWGHRHVADTRLVNVHVQRLRAKIEHDPEKPEYVVTVRGVGYKAGPP